MIDKTVPSASDTPDKKLSSETLAAVKAACDADGNVRPVPSPFAGISPR